MVSRWREFYEIGVLLFVVVNVTAIACFTAYGIYQAMLHWGWR